MHKSDQLRGEAMGLVRSGITLVTAKKRLATLERDSRRLADIRSSLSPGASRAKVTTANARWIVAAEARDRMIFVVEYLEGESR